MAKRTKFTATFSDGTVLTRSSDCRVYAAAWLAYGEREDGKYGKGWHLQGFSSSQEQARKNMDAETAFVRRNSGYTTKFSEVAPAEVAS